MMTDDQLLSLCLSELDLIDDSSELSEQREYAMESYLGEKYGDEVEGRSQVVTRETLETVEGLMPSLMRIFAEADNLVEFLPIGPEDEDQAAQETDCVNQIWWEENRGFYNTYTFIKDALLSKTGVLKVWADKTESVEREEYEGLTDIGLGQLLNEPYAEREVLEYELTEAGHHVVFKTTRNDCRIQVMPIAPEEFGIRRDARSPYISDHNFSFCRFRKTLGELEMEGFPREKLEQLLTDEDIGDSERLARRHLEDEEFGWSDAYSMRVAWVTECYVRVDRNEDGITELLKVTIGGDANEGGNGVLLDIEEIDSIPLFATPAVMLTHKFYGLSAADLVTDLQRIQTTLLRQVLDNTYLANNGMTAVNDEAVNIEDLLTKRPGGLVRYKGDMPWNAVVGPIPHNPLPQQTGEVFERLDERQKRRTGYGDEVGVLDPGALANINTGVAAMAFDQARAKIELLARVVAEIGLKPLFHHIHELMIKNKFPQRAMRLRNKWVEVNPSNWRTRRDSRVSIGIGRLSKERKIMGYEAILGKHREMTQEGAMGTLLMPWHVYEAYKGYIEAWGFEPDLFIQDPRQLPPPPPKGPDPSAELAQAQAQAMLMDGQSKMLRAQNERERIALEAQKSQREAQYKEAETFLKAQIESLKAQQAQMRSETEVTGKVISMQHETALRDTDSQLKAMQIQLDHLNATRDRDLEYYKTALTVAVKGETPESMAEREESEREENAAKAAAEAQKEMEREMREGQRDAWMVQLMRQVEALSNREPEDVEYDDRGLIKRIGKRAVTRDESGRVRRIG